MQVNVNVSNSYLQDQRFTNVSDKFNVVQPSTVGQSMANHGFNLVSLSTGKAKHEDKRDFQRTLSRYRGPEILPGIYIDGVYDSRHMGRGEDRLLLGIYRMLCTNGLFVGFNFFSHGVRHNGNTYDSLNEGIDKLLNMQGFLVEKIEKMQSVELLPYQREALADHASKLLLPDNALNIKHSLLRPNRSLDDKGDLWTIYNTIQENAQRGKSITYDLESLDETGQNRVRRMTARQIKPNTGKDAGFNTQLFDAAMLYAA